MINTLDIIDTLDIIGHENTINILDITDIIDIIVQKKKGYNKTI